LKASRTWVIETVVDAVDVADAGVVADVGVVTSVMVVDVADVEVEIGVVALASVVAAEEDDVGVVESVAAVELLDNVDVVRMALVVVDAVVVGTVLVKVAVVDAVDAVVVGTMDVAVDEAAVVGVEEDGVVDNVTVVAVDVAVVDAEAVLGLMVVEDSDDVGITVFVVEAAVVVTALLDGADEEGTFDAELDEVDDCITVDVAVFDEDTGGVAVVVDKEDVAVRVVVPVVTDELEVLVDGKDGGVDELGEVEVEDGPGDEVSVFVVEAALEVNVDVAVVLLCVTDDVAVLSGSEVELSVADELEVEAEIVVDVVDPCDPEELGGGFGVDDGIEEEDEVLVAEERVLDDEVDVGLVEVVIDAVVVFVVDVVAAVAVVFVGGGGGGTKPHRRDANTQLDAG